MKLRLSEDAQQDIERIDVWWRENRPAAPLLLLRELRDAMDQLETHPESETPYKEENRTYRRVVLPKTRYLLYYEPDKETGLLAGRGSPHPAELPPPGTRRLRRELARVARAARPARRHARLGRRSTR